jgi:glycosyltransferase involved in cell wall biosynthesis
MGKLSIFSLLSKLKCKVLCLEHGPYFAKSTFLKFLIKLLYKKINILVTITHADALNYKKNVKNIDVRPIYNASPYSGNDVSYNLESKKIIAIGRLAKEKRFDLLIKAWSKIHEKFPDWTLEIYGDGDLRKELLGLVNKLNISNINFFSNRADIEEVYKSAAFLVLTSEFEGLGMVLVEAQTFGLPLVSFDCPNGPREIITNNIDGFLVENANLDHLASVMVQLITSSSLRGQMSQNALKSSQKFNHTYISHQWLEILANL